MELKKLLQKLFHFLLTIFKCMKKTFFIIISLLFTVLLTHTAYAQTSTPKPTTSASPSVDESQVERIKDIVASRVAELNLVEKKGVLGKVISTTSTQITLEDINGDKRIIEIDELTKFKDPKNDDYGISDVKSNDSIGVIGLLNKAADRILARFVNTVTSIPEYFDGVVTETNAKNFQLTAVDADGKKKIIDIVTSTKTSSYTKEDGLIKSGFSKIKEGQRIYAAGFMDSKVDNQLNATRVIHFLDLIPSEQMLLHAQTTPPVKETPAPTQIP